jgi:hypothetical protein
MINETYIAKVATELICQIVWTVGLFILRMKNRIITLFGRNIKEDVE